MGSELSLFVIPSSSFCLFYSSEKILKFRKILESKLMKRITHMRNCSYMSMISTGPPCCYYYSTPLVIVSISIFVIIRFQPLFYWTLCLLLLVLCSYTLRRYKVIDNNDMQFIIPLLYNLKYFGLLRQRGNKKKNNIRRSTCDIVLKYYFVFGYLCVNKLVFRQNTLNI